MNSFIRFILDITSSHCLYCKKIWTKECPMRVMGRNEGNSFDVQPDFDFCSKFERRCDMTL